MSRRDEQTVEEACNDFLSMDQTTWDAMMESSRGGLWLTPIEQEGLSLALAEKIRRRQEEVDRKFSQ